MDNYAAHKTPEVKDWLADNPRIQVHFTPTSGSWLNLVEVWFGIIERQAIRRGTFTSVNDLNTKIRAFITGWNKRSRPFVWTKTADEVLAKAQRKVTSGADHYDQNSHSERSSAEEGKHETGTTLPAVQAFAVDRPGWCVQGRRTVVPGCRRSLKVDTGVWAGNLSGQIRILPR